jgi:hypothetical protein
MRKTCRGWTAGSVMVLALVAAAGSASAHDRPPSEVLDWNQVFVDAIVATNTLNSSSPRLGAIVHTSIFDAYNGIARRYTPLYVRDRAPRGASRRAAVVAAAHTALVALFPSQTAALDTRYAASLDALAEDGDDDSRSVETGLQWGDRVAKAVLAWRATDGFAAAYPPFRGGEAVGQWRPTPPAFASMGAQNLAFTSMFVLDSNAQFRPPSPRGLDSATYARDVAAVQALGRKTGSTRTPDQTALAPFWEGNASVHWNQAANQMAREHGLSLSRSARLFALLNLAMADTSFTSFASKRAYGADPTAVTWRPLTAITLADIDDNPATAPDPLWEPLITTPAHPEYPAGHPSLNGAGATVLLLYFQDRQTFTLTTAGLPSRAYSSISQARADGDAARVWGGMHYPSSVAASDAEGAAIARYIDEHAMRRVHGGR